jgi:hypothetical protein
MTSRREILGLMAAALRTAGMPITPGAFARVIVVGSHAEADHVLSELRSGKSVEALTRGSNGYVEDVPFSALPPDVLCTPGGLRSAETAYITGKPSYIVLLQVAQQSPGAQSGAGQSMGADGLIVEYQTGRGARGCGRRATPGRC